MTEIVVRLVEEASIEELLAGPYVCRFWLSANDDGTYGLHASHLDDPSGEALLRTLCGEPRDDVPPPLPESEEVAVQRRRWKALLDSLPKRGSA